MKRYRQRRRAWSRHTLWLWLVLVVLAGCAPAKVRVDASPDIEKYRVKTVAILPFDALSTPQVVDQRDTDLQAPSGATRSDITFSIPQTVEKFDQPTATVPPHVAARITQGFYDRLQVREGVQVLSREAVERAKQSLGATAKGAAIGEIARQVSAKLQADAVLVGRVLVYQERAGVRWGGAPATVGFEVKLVAADGKILWVGNYYEKQKPLFEDFGGFIQRGLGFLTADELLQYGIEHVLQQFPFGGAPAR
ncbi:MAG: hypothetical protein EPO64_07350 [Nitrospirae bacterium]|nr:MAG: hypothetical protein EPO64_07350 [Nitrospirota bacterium]